MDDSAGAIDRLPETTAVTLLRIVQEAVNNAVGHAGARSITVRLSATPRQIALSVTDDGKGLDGVRGAAAARASTSCAPAPGWSAARFTLGRRPRMGPARSCASRSRPAGAVDEPQETP